MVATLRKATFAPLVNQRFLIRPNEASAIPVILSSITTQQVNDQYESFTLNFDLIEDSAALPDDSYLMENEQLGQAVIFISPTHAGTPDPRKYYYEAVFNVYIGADGK